MKFNLFIAILLLSIYCQSQNRYEQSIFNELLKANLILINTNNIYLRIIKDLKEPDFTVIKEKANEINLAAEEMIKFLEEFEDLNNFIVEKDSLTNKGENFYRSFKKYQDGILAVIPEIGTKDGTYKITYEYLDYEKEDFIELFTNRTDFEFKIIIQSIKNSILNFKADTFPNFIPAKFININ